MINNYTDWQMPDPYNGLSEQERMKAGCLQMAGVVVAIIAGLLLCSLLDSCTTTEYVPVVETHEQHHWHTDSVKQKDSVYHEKTTVIQQLDSAAMAQYGIQLKAAERAWLVRTAELEKQLQQLQRLTADRDTVRDTIPLPYPVEKIVEVAAPLTWWQKILMWMGVLLIMIFFGWVWKTK